MSHHDGSKPYQPRRGPERPPPPAPADDAAAHVAPTVDHLAAVAAEAEAMTRFEEEHRALGAEEEDEEEEDELEEEEEEMEEDEDAQHHEGVGGEVAVPMDAEAAAQLDPHGGMLAASGAVQPMASNQLTLSFQGEVYVFDSVSPDKVVCLSCAWPCLFVMCVSV